MSGIKISQNHGVNPSIPICFFCHRPKNEIVLMGKLKDDRKAPMYCIVDQEPCDKCKKDMAMGIALVGTRNTPVSEQQPAIGNDLYLTGDFIVIAETFVQNIFKPEDVDTILANKKALVPQELLDDIMATAKDNNIDVPTNPVTESESE